jgi:CelD/BcsL family acetyltransferase involved in cellulose biosynthesis
VGSLQLTVLERFPEGPGEWTALSERAGNLFGTWEWLTTWWRHFGRGRLMVSECRDASGELRAVLPLYATGSWPLRTLRFVGHGPADQLGPIAAPLDMPRAGDALCEVLQRERWDLFLAQDVPAKDGLETMLGARELYRLPSPVLDLKGLDWDGFLGSRSRGFRAELGRLQRRHRVRHRPVTDPDELGGALATFFRMHDELWRGRGGSASFRGRLREFHRDFARLALERGWLRLRVLELDGRFAGALYNFRFAGREYFYESVRDPRLKGPGFLLHCDAIRNALNDDLSAYLLLRGSEPYKWRFAGRDAPVATIGLATTGAATSALAGARHARRLPPHMRRHLPALYQLAPKEPRRQAAA